MSSSDEFPVLISNIEVLNVLHKCLKDRKGGPKRKYQHRDWVEVKVVEYLECTPCAKLDKKRHVELKKTLMSQKKQVFAIDSTKSTGYGLTEAEAVQVLNFMPTEPVEIHLLIEELHDRMPEKQQDELLAVISSFVVHDSSTITQTGHKDLSLDINASHSEDLS